MITVKKDRSVKIALDARILNQAIEKDKYQMPNLENLLVMVAIYIRENDNVALYQTSFSIGRKGEQNVEVSNTV